MSNWAKKAEKWGRDGTGRSVRRLRGVSLRTLASWVGTSKSALHYWETGHLTPAGEPGRRWAQWIESNLKEVTP